MYISVSLLRYRLYFFRLCSDGLEMYDYFIEFITGFY